MIGNGRSRWSLTVHVHDANGHDGGNENGAVDLVDRAAAAVRTPIALPILALALAPAVPEPAAADYCPHTPTQILVEPSAVFLALPPWPPNSANDSAATHDVGANGLDAADENAHLQVHS